MSRARPAPNALRTANSLLRAAARALLVRAGVGGKIGESFSARKGDVDPPVLPALILDLADLETLHRMIAAVVAEFELVRPAAQCQPDELVSEADAEDRSLAHELTNILLRVGHRLGITRAIRQKNSIGL